MKNVIVYLMGPPGVGKYTVGKVMAERIPAKLLDNHFWSNPIFEVLEPDGTPFPAGAWDRANDVRSAVLETVALFGPAARNYIFTHAITEPGGDPIDWIIAGQILRVVERRRASLLVARLICGEKQLRERIVSEDRSPRLKITDATWATSLASVPPFPINHDWIVDVDTTDLTALETADRIEAELNSRIRA